MSPSGPEVLECLAAQLGEGEHAWLVGGAIRDALLDRPHPDYDLAIAGDARRLARSLAARTGGFSFSLSDSWGAWRVSAGDRSWQVDLTPLTGSSIEQDLCNRDLTVNAIAQSLRADVELGRGELVDPSGGISDLHARRLRAVGPESFSADPLRVMRTARLAAELEFAVEHSTTQLALASASALGEVAAERVFAELSRLLCSRAAVSGVRWLRDLGAMAVVLPELEALSGVEQSNYHHLDVYEHTLATLQATIDLDRDPAIAFPEDAERLRRYLDLPFANQLSRGQALRFGGLFHDIAKPLTRAVGDEGRVTFHDHDVRGAELIGAILGRLRASDRLAQHVSALARHHLRLGFMVHEQPLSRRQVFAYLHTTEPVEVDVTLLSVADRLATRGRNADQAVARHLELAVELLPQAIDWFEQPPAPPVRGDRLAEALGIAPGPELGPLLEGLREAAYAGEIDGEREAIEYARTRLR